MEGPFALTIEYNDAGAFTAISGLRAGLSMSLGSAYSQGTLSLVVTVRDSEGPSRHHQLLGIRPSDHVRVTYG